MMNKKIDLRKSLARIREYERESVPNHKLKGIGSFAGIVISEHITATEFVIGPLFVLHGATVADVFLGLFFGNLFATLSWALICTPAAVKTRYTVHYQFEKIAGRGLTTIYNVIKSIMFCITVSAMIIVSTSAISPFLNIDAPGLTDLYITNLNWFWLVILVGLIVMAVTISGFEKITRFANLFAPWIPLVLIGAGIAILPELGVYSISDFWTVAQEKIWTGNEVAGQTKYTFIHIFIFSWLCNSTMHIGLSDMSIYRYAKKSYYGYVSGLGMYTGHLLTWISSGILCAVAIQRGNENPSPGELAYMGAGVIGVICILFAGLTSAIPTMYRAGLAVQSSFKNVRLWKITMIICGVSIILSLFPAIISKLDQFLGITALIVSPVGAVIIADLFVFPKLNLETNLAEKKDIYINPAVMSSWIGSVSFGYVIYEFFKLDFYFFVALPAWLICFVLYLTLSLIQQKGMVNKPNFDVYVNDKEKV